MGAGENPGARGAAASPVKSDWLSPEAAVRAYVRYEARYKARYGREYARRGRAPDCRLAWHAAFPLYLDAELVNLIHANFLGGEGIPWHAEADFLLSPLCRPVGPGLYRVDPVVREVLLFELVRNMPRPAERLLRLADFLLAYVDRHPDPAGGPALAQAYRWIAAAYLRPGWAASEMRQTLERTAADLGTPAELSAQAQQLQVAQLSEVLHAPLAAGLPAARYADVLEASNVLARYWYRGPAAVAGELAGAATTADAGSPLKVQVVTALRRVTAGAAPGAAPGAVKPEPTAPPAPTPPPASEFEPGPEVKGVPEGVPEGISEPPPELPLAVQPMVLYVAVPERVAVQRPFTVAVALRRPDSPELDESDELTVIRGDAKVEFGRGQETAELEVRVSSPQCTSEPGLTAFRLRRGEDSPTFYVDLAPTGPGSISVEVDLDQDGSLVELVYAGTTADIPQAAPISEPQDEEPAVEGDLGKLPTEDFPDCCAAGDGSRFYGSGILVAPRLVLTAGSMKGMSHVFLRGSDVAKLEAGEVINVIRDVEHPELDLRALFLERAASVAPRPIALGVDDAPPAEALFAGFGTIDRDGKLGFGRKRYVRLPIMSLGCDGTGDPKRYGCRQGSELVAGGQGRDSSRGDAGGPLYVAGPDGSYALLATCSRSARGGATEAGDGGIYVRIDRVLDWLRSIGGTDPSTQVATVGEPPEKLVGVSPWVPLRDPSVPRRAIEAARPVCRIVFADGSAATGFLTAGNLLITNHHVLPDLETAAAARIEFNYERDEQGLDQTPDVYTLDPQAGFATSPEEDQGGDDWTAVRVKGDPAERWGALTLVALPDGAPRAQDEVTLIGHPGGGRKQIASSGNVIIHVDSRRIQYATDTPEGSSGSPVFNMGWRVIGLHARGGWQGQAKGVKPSYANQAIHVNVLIAGLRAAGLLEETVE